jgi:chromosome segregation ATPase
MNIDWQLILNIVSTIVLALIAYRSAIADTGIFKLKVRENEDKDLILNAEQSKSIIELKERLDQVEDELGDHEKLNANSFENMYKDFNMMISEYKKFFDQKAEKINTHDVQLSKMEQKVEKLESLREKDSALLSNLQSDISGIKASITNVETGMSEIKQFIFNQRQK